ncbi:MAG: phosphatidylglycerol lysyltransferase domain-containing protein [Symbiobacteriaceae bacterium]|nr:phosphatidylglycerol lysyltransferase domain-containing protein [Symbiobacteriaceae bacterium]
MNGFQPFTLTDKDKLQPFLRLYPDNETSEYTFSYFYMWRSMDDAQWLQEKDYLLLRLSTPGDKRFFMAMAPEAQLAEAMEHAIAISREEGWPFTMNSLPEWYCELLAKHMPGRFDFTHELHLDDYIYHIQDLINLRGNRYHAKRNHRNRFDGVYGDRYAYLPYSSDMATACLAIYESWFQTQPEAELLRRERDSVQLALADFQALGLDGGVATVDGIPMAFTLGEQLTEDMAVIHTEKAMPAIPELFTVINRDFLSHTYPHLTWINREEDMGDPGLRKAKRSYHPARMIAKYRITLKTK